MTCVTEEGMVGDVKKRPFSICTYICTFWGWVSFVFALEKSEQNYNDKLEIGVKKI